MYRLLFNWIWILLCLTFVFFSNQALAEQIEFTTPKLIYDSEDGKLYSYELSRNDKVQIAGLMLPLNLVRKDFVIKTYENRLVLHTKFDFYYFTRIEESIWQFERMVSNNVARNANLRIDQISFFAMDDFGIYIFMSKVKSSNQESHGYIVESEFYSDQDRSKIIDVIEGWLQSSRDHQDFQTYFRHKLPGLHNKVSKQIAQKEAQRTPKSNRTSIENIKSEDLPLITTRGEDGQIVDAWDLINSFAEDMIEMSKNFVYTEMPELREIEDQILRNFLMIELGSVKLLAPPGVGKSYLMERLAYRFRVGDVPKALKGYKILSFTGAAIDAGTKYVGAIEARGHAIVKVSKETKVIWFVDEAHTLSGVGTSANRKSNIMQIFKPALARGVMKALLASTSPEWNSNFADDGALNRRLSEVGIPIPNKKILTKILHNWVLSNNLTPLSEDVLDMVIFYSDEFEIEGVQPSKATKLLDTLYSYYNFEDSTGPVTLELLNKAVKSLYRVDPSELEFEQRRIRYEQIVSELENLIGQTQAKETILERARQIMTGIYDRTKPRYRVLFAGPKGQGKTEIIRLLSKAYGQDEPHRVVMSDLTSPYQGDELKARIGQILQANPMAFILFDELEKAHPAIQTILISALDAGFITYNSRSSGELKIITLSLKNASVFATTNAGSDYITQVYNGKGSIGFGQQGQTFEMDELKKRMILDGIDGYVLDRFDGVVPFSFLNIVEFVEVIKKQIQNAVQKISSFKKLDIRIPDLQTFSENLAEEHFKPEQSMRDVARLIEVTIRRPISDLIFDLKTVADRRIELKYEDRKITASILPLQTETSMCEAHLSSSSSSNSNQTQTLN